MFLDDSDYNQNAGGYRDSQNKAHTGLVVFNVNEVESEKLIKGLYTWDGEKWVSMQKSGDGCDDDDDPGTKPPFNLEGIKINPGQSDYFRLAGTQPYGVMLQNQNIRLSPSYIEGKWPEGSSKPTDVITGTGNGGDRSGILLDNPIKGKANFFSLNFYYRMGNNPVRDTRYFTVKVTPIGNNSKVIYETQVVIPGNLNPGHSVPFNIFFGTLASESSIGKGYQLIFAADTAGSEGLSDNVFILLRDVMRISSIKSK